MIQTFQYLPQPIYVIADPHGSLKAIEGMCEHIKNCILIIAGDIGLGFSSQKRHELEYKELNNFLITKEIQLFLVRGNHDDPRYFSEGVINFSNVRTVKDYTVLTVGNHNILMIGGGISIDRRYRITKYNNDLAYFKEMCPKLSEEQIIKAANLTKYYWEDEGVVCDERKLKEINELNLPITHVITHTCPSFCFPQGFDTIKEWFVHDKNLESDLIIERKEMDNIYQILTKQGNRIKYWIYGHFHTAHTDVINDTVFKTLNNCDASFDIFSIPN